MNTKPPKFHYEITFPDFEPSQAIRSEIEGYLARLEKIFDRIITCHVAIRAPHLHQKKHIYYLSLHLEIPGEDIIITHEPGKNIAHANIHVAIRDAFNALHRKLRKQIEKRRETTPPRDTYKTATVISFDPNDGYGFIQDAQGREIYFHQNSLIHQQRAEVKPGTKVRFVEEHGEKGTQVTSMTIA